MVLKRIKTHNKENGLIVGFKLQHWTPYKHNATSLPQGCSIIQLSVYMMWCVCTMFFLLHLCVEFGLYVFHFGVMFFSSSTSLSNASAVCDVLSQWVQLYLKLIPPSLAVWSINETQNTQNREACNDTYPLMEGSFLKIRTMWVGCKSTYFLRLSQDDMINGSYMLALRQKSY